MTRAVNFFKKVWKGIKKGASWVQDKVKRVGKGLGNGAEKVVNGVKTVATPVVKVVKKGVSTVGKLIGKGAKWAAENPEAVTAIATTVATVGKAVAAGLLV